MPGRDQFVRTGYCITKENVIIMVAIVTNKVCIQGFKGNQPSIGTEPRSSGWANRGANAVRIGIHQRGSGCLHVTNVQVVVPDNGIGDQIGCAAKEGDIAATGVERWPETARTLGNRVA